MGRYEITLWDEEAWLARTFSDDEAEAWQRARALASDNRGRWVTIVDQETHDRWEVKSSSLA